MSKRSKKKKNKKGKGGAGEYQVVIRRNSGRGPLAPHRLSLSLLFTLIVSGNSLLNAAQTGVDIDMAMIRAGVAALFAWMVVGHVSSILAAASAPPTPLPSPSTDGNEPSDNTSLNA